MQWRATASLSAALRHSKRRDACLQPLRLLDDGGVDLGVAVAHADGDDASKRLGRGGAGTGLRVVHTEAHV